VIDVRVGLSEELLALVPSDSIDAIVTDPPYNVALHTQVERGLFAKKGKAPGKALDLDFGPWDYFDSDDAYKQFMATWLAEAYRVLRDGSTATVFCAVEFIGDLQKVAESVGFRWLRPIAWLKLNPAPRLAAVNRYTSGFEGGGWVCKRVVKTFNGGPAHPNYWISPIVQGRNRQHPTQKHTAVLQDMIEVVSNPGDTILDPFAGSCSTGVAAKLAGRNAILMEANPSYAARGRLWIDRTPEPLFVTAKAKDDFVQRELFLPGVA